MGGLMQVTAAQAAGSTVATAPAIHGYDPVAYFTEQKPVRGNPEYRVEWNGASWLFASKEHSDMFKAAPEKYAPQYGGFCAYGVSEGYAAESDPGAWTVHEGKLYLNWDADVMKDWRADMPARLRRSEANWTSVKQGLENGTATLYWK